MIQVYQSPKLHTSWPSAQIHTVWPKARTWTTLKKHNPVVRVAHRAAQVAQLTLNPGRQILPQIQTVNFMVTDRCNGRCVFCNIGRSYNGEDMDTQTIVQGLPETFPHLKKVSITGGEAMMRRDMAQLYHQLSEHGYYLNVVTNAQFPNRTRQFVDVNPDARISTSLHGLGELHNTCMGLPHAWDKFHETIKYLPGKIGAGMTVCSLNYDKILSVYDYLHDLGIFFAVNVMDISELYYQNTDLTGMLPTLAMREVMIEQMQQVRTTQELWKEMQIELLQGHRRDFDCWSGRLQVFIHNSGRIYPCIYMDKLIQSLQLGSLQSHTVKQINMGPCRRCLTHCEAMSSIMAEQGRAVLTDRIRGKIRRNGQ